MELSSSQLSAFSAAAKSLNFTKAAEAVHITQSALSQRIAKLEEELETTLFIRDRSSIRLTEAGHRLLRFCQLNDLSEAELIAELKGQKNEIGGLLRIGAFSSIARSILVPSLRDLMTKHQNLGLEVVTKELWELSSLLARAEVDYIITSIADESPGMESIFLGEEFNVLVASKKYLNTEVLLDHDSRHVTTQYYMRKTRSKLNTNRMRYLDDVYGLIDGVKNGYGIAVLPLHLIADEKDLKIIEPDKVLRVPVYLQFFKQPYYRKIHSTAVEAIRAHFAKVLSKN